MRLLADTHALLWWLAGSSELSAPAQAALADPANDVYISAATAWENAQRFGEVIAAEGFHPLVLTLEHAQHAGSYAQAHGDPFDRMLAAQCELEALTLVTRDPAFQDFPCPTLW